MWPNFINTLSWWQWLILAAVPPAIIALYFLKLKRKPLEVPSTYLWSRSIEDLHVNSVWQRLRRNLLLLLQLLLLLLAMLALVRPNWRGMQLGGERFIFLVDNSASMQATDVESSRLEEAKRRAIQLIDQMKSGDVGMVISFADTPKVEQMFTDDRGRLRRAVEAIQPTQRSTSLAEALKAAAGLANPGRTSQDETDFQVAEALPAELYIFSDGRFGPVTGFSLGNLSEQFIVIGRSDAKNVGIMALSVGRDETDRQQLHAFTTVRNFGTNNARVKLDLFLDDRLIDADELTVAAGKEEKKVYPLGPVETGVLKLRLSPEDHLALDNEAWAVVSPPEPARVLLVTPGNEPLQLALRTEATAKVADVSVQQPEFLDGQSYVERSASGAYDLIVYDGCQPKQMPQANTLFIGSLPPKGGWSAGPLTDFPAIIDYEVTHPLFQWIDLSDVLLMEGRPVKPPSGGGVLIDSDRGPMFAIAPREGYQDAVLGFAIVGQRTDDSGKTDLYYGTNWPGLQSFPVFVLNLLSYFGGFGIESGHEAFRPGQPVTIEDRSSRLETLRVRTPAGQSVAAAAARPGRFSFADTTESGVYAAQGEGVQPDRFAVNLFDPVESRIRIEENPVIQIGYVDVEGKSDWEPARREAWKWLLLLGLVVLLLEWYIYNRRVHL